MNFLQTIAEGWAYPLRRFMNEQELIESLNMNTVTDEEGKKHILSVPITQHITAEQKEQMEGQSQVALKFNNEVFAIIEEPEIFDNRKEEICAKTFGTSSQKHPMIKEIHAQGDYLLSGKEMRFTNEVTFDDGLDQYRLTPA